MQNAILYTRCSTEEQGKKGNSHEYQIAGLRNAGRGFTEVAHFQDTVSGTKFDNRAGGLDAAYLLCERQRGKVDYLLVYRWDRLGRDVSECFQCIKKFKSVGVEVNCPDEWMDFSDPSYPLILAVKFGMAQSESMRISDRTRDGLHQTLVSGIWTNFAPVGYKKGAPRIVNGKERRLCEIVPEKAGIIKTCFEQYALGAQKHELRIKYMKALEIERSQFERMFHNPFYCGLIPIKAHRQSVAQLIQGQHEPIISRELFDRCQQVQVDQNPPTLGKTWTLNDPGGEFYLKGVIRCPYTGRKMTAYRAKGKSGQRFPYYSSPKMKGGQIVSASKAHALVNRALSGMRIDQTTHDELRNEAQAQMAERIKTFSKEADQARKGLQRNQERLHNISEQFADKELTAAEYRTMKAGFDRDALRFEHQLQEAESQLQAQDDTIEQIISLLSGIDTIFAASDFSYKSLILKAIFPLGLSLDTKNGKVRTPEVNEVILSMCSTTMNYECIEIENGANLSTDSIEGGECGKFRTHMNLLKTLFAA